MSDYQTEQALENRGEGGGQASIVMPFYIICDTSGSMQPHMRELNAALAGLVSDITNDPVVDDTVMLSIISFGTNAVVDTPLGYASEITPPNLPIRGGTNYGSALRAYGEAVRQDYARLKAQGFKFFRPCVFFLTDGLPQDHWETAFGDEIRYDPETKQGNRMYPYIVCYGFGEVSQQPAAKDVLAKLAYPNFGPKRGKAFLAREDNVHELLKSIAGAIGNSIVSSGLSGTNGGTQQVNIPQAVEGAETIEPDTDVF